MNREDKENLLTLIQEFINENAKPTVEVPKHFSLTGGTFKEVDSQVQRFSKSSGHINPKELDEKGLNSALRRLINC